MSLSLRFSLARVTVEFTSPFLIGTGGTAGPWDTAFAADANGLPILPGASIAGVLRHTFLAQPDRPPRGDHPLKHDRESLFGFQDGSDGAASRVIVSAGQPHDSHDRPASFHNADLRDPVLRALCDGVARDHVRVNGRGVADGAGKFDVLAVPAGARFTFELTVRDDPAGEDLLHLLKRLHDDGMRLGSRTRRGLGAFFVCRSIWRAFDLKRDFDAYAKLPTALEDPIPPGVLTSTWSKADVPATVRGDTRSEAIRGTLTLKPESYWMFGAGTPDEGQPRHQRNGSTKGTADRVPASEVCIRWNNGKGAVCTTQQAPEIAPATGLKGALRHRVAFHARRQAGDYAAPGRDVSAGPDLVPAIKELFGSVGNGRDGQPEEGQAGRLVISDGVITGAKHGWLDHVSLDRFTQGPMDGLLFSEAPLHRGTLTYDLALQTHNLPVDARRALRAAIRDLCEARLPLGAHGSRGLGYARGELTGPLNNWLKESP